MESLNILYVGDTKNSSLLSTLGEAMMPTNAHEALAMYVLYFPDVVVFDGYSEMAHEAFYHLSSGVTASSPQVVETMLVLADGDRWQTPPNTVLKQLPARASAAAIQQALADLMDARLTARMHSYETVAAPMAWSLTI
jgi:hypothetical protein